MDSSGHPTDRGAMHPGAMTQQRVTPSNPAQLPFPSQLLGGLTGGRSASRGSALEHGQTNWANLDELNRADDPISPGLDWENAGRPRSSSSVIDNASVTDDSGRTFHGYKEGKYFLPNDAAEQDRLDMQYAAFKLLLRGRLHLAPLKDPKFALDVATGTGIWALDFAETYPGAQVIGTDLSDIQPKWKLPNCSFIQDDAEDEWLFGSTEMPIQFDFIHLGLVVTCFNNPRTVMKHAYKNLRPGGWIEYMDVHLAASQALNHEEFIQSSHYRWIQLFSEGLAKAGRDPSGPSKYAQWLRDEGFVDVVEEKFILPTGTWPESPRLKKVGQFIMADFEEGMRGGGWKLLKLLGMSAAEIEDVVANAKEDIRSNSYVVYARKPLESEIVASA